MKTGQIKRPKHDADLSGRDVIVSLERRISLLKVSYQIYFQTLFFIPHLSGEALHN